MNKHLIRIKVRGLTLQFNDAQLIEFKTELSKLLNCQTKDISFTYVEK